MQWADAIKTYTQRIKDQPINYEWVQRIYQLIDLTSLNDDDTESSISFFCQKATTASGHVAAVCTYPRFTKLVAAELADKPIKVATVANFPHGKNTLQSTLIEIGIALENGAQEIDVVFPYQHYLTKDKQYAHSFIVSCKAACGDNVKLKVILETSMLQDFAIIAAATKDAILAGADFIKTSTGKIIEGGATLETSAIILLTIREMTTSLNREVGFKVAGGIKDLQQAIGYTQLVAHIMGQAWIKPATFRIGTSKLIDEILRYDSKH